MHVFNSRADFDAQMKSVKKWMRTGQALDGVADLQHDGRRLFLPQQVVFVRLGVCFAPLRGVALLTPFSPFPLAGAPSTIALAARTVVDEI